ncbi:MAG: hypothetical protein CSA33_06625 [Desulfobulbus propionicus]|nr:MAG: hypothetical protein CSA33_06625 [Desulfobulbus propionicus]
MRLADCRLQWYGTKMVYNERVDLGFQRARSLINTDVPNAHFLGSAEDYPLFAGPILLKKVPPVLSFW